jgi:hypothetical protein
VSDSRVRDLERAAKQGDHNALAQLKRLFKRAGSPWHLRRAALEAEHSVCGCPGPEDVKPTLPEVAPQFYAYLERRPGWGSLHAVVEDLNVSDCHVEGAIKYAERDGDEEGAKLARLLLRMSPSQRKKLGSFMERWHRVCWSSGHGERRWHRAARWWYCAQCSERHPEQGPPPPNDGLPVRPETPSERLSNTLALQAELAMLNVQRPAWIQPGYTVGASVVFESTPRSPDEQRRFDHMQDAIRYAVESARRHATPANVDLALVSRENYRALIEALDPDPPSASAPPP